MPNAGSRAALDCKTGPVDKSETVTHAKLRVAPNLETRRLVLRGFEMRDFDSFCEKLKNPVVMAALGGPIDDRAVAWEKFVRGPGFWSLLGFGLWTVEEKATKRYMGDVGFGVFERPFDPPMPAVPEAAWVLDEWAHGAGFGSEAVSAMLQWADDNLDFDRYTCIIPHDALPSIKLAENMGFAPVRTVQFKEQDTVVYERPAGRTTA